VEDLRILRRQSRLVDVKMIMYLGTYLGKALYYLLRSIVIVAPPLDSNKQIVSI